MIYLESPSTNPYFNLALEQYIFDTLGRRQDYFMLWQNENTIVVGKYQNTAEEINSESVERYGIRVVRRLSGGGAVYHDKGNLNFTFVVGKESNPDCNFQVFVLPVVEALSRLGVQAAFTGRNDITIDGKKFSGNSQYSKEDRLMHHGCIMLESNLERVNDALRVKEAKFESKSTKSVRSRVTTINTYASEPIPMALFKQTLLECVQEKNPVEFGLLAEEDLAAVAKLQREKYETWDWNYGISPDYDMRREMKFPGGLVTVFLNASAGRIQSVRFFGDFFGSGDLSELEHAMTGLPLDENLESALKCLNVGLYMSGISAGELCQLIR